MTKEDALHSDENWVAYEAAKKYAELAVWEWAKAHPEVDVTTSKSIILSPKSLSYKILLNSTPTLHLRSIRIQISSTSKA